MQMTQKPWETAHVGVADFMCDELVLHVETRREKVLQRPSTQLLFLLRAEEERKRKQDGKQTFRQKKLKFKYKKRNMMIWNMLKVFWCTVCSIFAGSVEAGEGCWWSVYWWMFAHCRGLCSTKSQVKKVCNTLHCRRRCNEHLMRDNVLLHNVLWFLR